MDLEIKYYNGSMIIHLGAFLDCRSIRKVKKLVKQIIQSNTPDALEDLKEFIKQGIEQFEPQMKQIKSDFDTCVKNKAFYEKVLETIS